MIKLSLVCGAAAMLASSAVAQVQFETAFGTALAAGDDVIRAGQALGFNFPMPGGAVVTAVDIDTNGRILPPGGDTSDLGESVVEMLTDTLPHASICMQWDDLNPASTVAGVDDVYFNTDGTTKAWVTWNNVVQFGATVLHTMQVQLFADGRIVFLYDSRCPALDGLVGLSQGGGAADPGGSNLSAAPIQTNGVTTIYEIFTSGFDLQGRGLEFFPDTQGGWLVLASAVADVNATIASSGVGCYAAPDGPCLVYAPDGIGGYIVSRTIGLYDPNIGASAGITGDDVISAGQRDLTFVFPFPGGTSSQFIDIDSNGRVLRDATESGSDLSPTVAEFSTEAWPAIAVWADWNVAPAGSDDIYFSTTPGTSARITWKDVMQFGAGAVPCTFQIQLLVGGTIIICLEDLRGFNPAAPFVSADDLLVGISAGNGIAAPGETDYMGLVGAVSSPAISYEFTDTPAEIQDYTPPNPLLVSVTPPRVNTNWDLRIDQLNPGTLAAWFMIGFTNPALDLGLIGVPCFLRVDPQITVPAALPGGSSTGVLSIPIGASSQIGLPVMVQGVTAFTGVNPFLPIVLTNGLTGSVGY